MADWNLPEYLKDKIIEGDGYDGDGILNITDKEAGLTIVDPDNPVDIVKFGKVLVGTLFATVVIALGNIQQAITDIIASVPTALGSFASDIVTAVLATPENILETAATTSANAIEAYGVFALVVGVGVALAGLYVVARVLEVIAPWE